MRKATVGTTGSLLLASGLVLSASVPAAAAPTAPADRIFRGEDSSDRAPDCTEAKCVALTFDDGPGEYTDELLDVLDEHDAKATFYVLGSKIGKFEDTVERMAEDGHEVGNHTWDHEDLATLSADQIKDDLERTDRAIADVTGEKPATMRPPYGSLSDTAREAIHHPILLWDVDTLDWQHRDSDKILDITLDETDQGSVVLFHDIHESSVDAIPDVLDELADQDYEFVTVTDLFEDDLEPGTAYSDARPKQ
ncbi:polysaccharide deacetylase family protein [Nocardiopsis exhalans]|nr:MULTISPECIES: polysaccharide deacetylase family protein [Nocardiopsis]USY23305.1 polysaccharide deacetylase family protein [Nocardiopsis exhalans]